MASNPWVEALTVLNQMMEPNRAELLHQEQVYQDSRDRLAKKEAKDDREWRAGEAQKGYEAQSARDLQQNLLNHYYKTQAKYDKLSKSFDNFNNLPEEWQTDGGQELKKFFDEKGKMDLKALDSSIVSLNADITKLQGHKKTLQDQKGYFIENQDKFSGVIPGLQPHEFDNFKEYAITPASEGGLGWDTYAGAQAAYRELYPSDEAAYKTAQILAKEPMAKQEAKANEEYLFLQTAFTTTTDIDMETIIQNYTYINSNGERVAMSQDVYKQIKSMLSSRNYDDFLNHLYAYGNMPGGQVIREVFTGSGLANNFKNLESAASQYKIYDLEQKGIRPTHQLDSFQEDLQSIANIESQSDAFDLYDTYVKGLHSDDHQQYWDVLQVYISKLDEESYKNNPEDYDEVDSNTLFDRYSSYKKAQEDSQRILANTGALSVVDMAIFDKYDTGEKIFNALDSLSKLGNLSSEQGSDTSYSKAEWKAMSFIKNLSNPKVSDGAGSPAPAIMRYKWSPGKAFGAGLWAWDSNYYDVFYNTLDKQYNLALAEQDPGIFGLPFGPDFVHNLQSEHLTPRKFEINFPDKLEKALEIADKAARESQITHLNTILKRGSGEDYYDLKKLLTILDQRVLQDYTIGEY